MVETLDKGTAIIGSDFVAHAPQFDVLHNQTREVPPVVPHIDLRAEIKKPLVENPEIPQSIEQVQKPEKKTWSVPQSFIDEVSSFVDKKGNESRKGKLGAFKFDIEDEKDPSTVAEKIHDAVDTDVLTHDEAGVLFGLLRQDAEKRGGVVLPAEDLREEAVTEPVVQEPEVLEAGIPVEEVVQAPTSVELVDVEPSQSVYVTPEAIKGDNSLDGTVEYIEPSIESLNEKVKDARILYFALYNDFQKNIDINKERFEKTMADLGGSGRQMPQISLPIDFIRAQDSYIVAKKNMLAHMRAHGSSMDDQLKFMEQEDILFEKSTTEGGVTKNSKILSKAFGKIVAAPLPDRFSTGSKILAFVGEKNSLTGGPFLVSSGKKTLSDMPVVSMPVESEPLVQGGVSTEAIQVDQPSEVLIEGVQAGDKEGTIEPITSVASTVDTPSSLPMLEKNIDVVQGGTIEGNNESRDKLEGKAPLAVEFQFDEQYKDKRRQYSINFHKALIDAPDAVDASLPIDYMGGQIVALQHGPELTLLLNGQKIGEGTVRDGKMKLVYVKPINDPAMFGVKSNFETAFEFAKPVLEKKIAFFR